MGKLKKTRISPAMLEYIEQSGLPVHDTLIAIERREIRVVRLKTLKEVEANMDRGASVKYPYVIDWNVKRTIQINRKECVSQTSSNGLSERMVKYKEVNK